MDFFKDRIITKVDWLIIGVSLFLLVMLTLGYVFANNYVQNQVAQLDKEIAGKKAELADLRQKEAQIDKIEKEIEEMRKVVASFEGRLPTDKEVPKLLRQFQKIAELSGVKYQLVKTEPLVEKDLNRLMPFANSAAQSIDTARKYDSIRTRAMQLEKLRKVVILK